jgi:hypothetical protein
MVFDGAVLGARIWILPGPRQHHRELVFLRLRQWRAVRNWGLYRLELSQTGVGTLTTAATSVQALARGFSQVGWHCWDNNVGSIGVAEKVGFKRATDYDVFINHWAAENVTDMTQEEFRAFARYYEREFQTQPPISGFPHIVAAKAWALSGDRSGCFRHLNKAIDICWLSSVEQLREIWPEFFLSPDLDEMQEWQDLVKRMDEPIENGHVTPG